MEADERARYKVLLDLVLERLNTPAKWYKGNVKLRHEGITLTSAIMRAARGPDINTCYTLGNLIQREAKLAFPDRGDYIIHFNDHLDTTYDDVIYVITAAKTQLELDDDGDERDPSLAIGEEKQAEEAEPLIQDEPGHLPGYPWGV